MRSLIWISLFVAGLLGVLVPVGYFYVASQLPTLDSELDVEKLLRLDIEGERRTEQMGRTERDPAGQKFERPDFSRLPKDLVAFYISQRGCPTFFQTPREAGARWVARLVVGLAGKELRGDGFCERLLALRLAERVGARGALLLTVGANKIHSVLEKDQLIAYDLSSVWFEPGIIGAEALARRLFHKELSQLRLSELAELTLALPPHGYYAQMRDCQNPSLIRANRDHLLAELAADDLIPVDRSKSAQAEPVACAR